MRKTAEEAYAPFFGLQQPLIPYRDASFGVCTYHLEVLDCARAVARAASLGHLNLDKFNPEKYAFYDKIEHGDLNWIIPGKFVAFSGPLTKLVCTCGADLNAEKEEAVVAQLVVYANGIADVLRVYTCGGVYRCAGAV